MDEATTNCLASRQTSDSNDDLMEDCDNDVDEGINHSPVTRTTRDPHSKYHAIWDCKAVQLPPHSLHTIARAGYEYAQSLLFFEVLFLGVFVWMCAILPAYLVQSHYRPVPLQFTRNGEALIDLTFANEYHPNETIPGSLLTVLCVWVPVGLFALVGVFLGPPRDFHAALCSYLLAMGIKIFVVACIKRYSGYLRPSFYNMCLYNSETQLCDDEATSARESFPSGHAATALSSMTLVTLFLLGKVRGACRQRGIKLERETYDPSNDALVWTPSFLSKLLAVVSLSPIGLGMFIATSRVRDNWHHPADVVCGGIIGVGCALFAHSLWYPSVYSAYAGIPLSTVAEILKARSETSRHRLDVEDSVL